MIEDIARTVAAIKEKESLYLVAYMSKQAWDDFGKQLYEEQEGLRDYLHSIDAEDLNDQEK